MPRFRESIAMAAASEADVGRPSVEPVPDLGDREVAVLSEIAREGEASVAFQGLRRRLYLHQEALSRTLRRLSREGFVARDEGGGYRLTEQGFVALRGRAPARARRDPLTVAQALLPPHVTTDMVVGQLARRWFRGLRWYGRAEGPGETTLAWLAEPSNATVRVRVGSGTVALEVETPGGIPREAFGAARGVLAAVAELYGMGSAGEASREPLVETLAEAPGYAA
jgi:uncharacterized protein YjhX (UPF0386 family)